MCLLVRHNGSEAMLISNIHTFRFVCLTKEAFLRLFGASNVNSSIPNHMFDKIPSTGNWQAIQAELENHLVSSSLKHASGLLARSYRSPC